MKFVIIDYGSTPTPDLDKIAAAVQTQVNRDASGELPFNWQFVASIRVAPSTETPGSDEVVIGLYDSPAQAGALGDHSTKDSGLAFIEIYTLLDAQSGVSVSSTISHEVLETLGDSQINLAAQSSSDGKFWAFELCDAVESDSYEIDGIQVSNFVLPPYFSPPKNLDGVKLDFMGLCKTPYEIRPGGYGQYFDPQAGWQQVQSQQRRASFSMNRKHESGYGRRRGATKSEG